MVSDKRTVIHFLWLLEVILAMIASLHFLLAQMLTHIVTIDYMFIWVIPLIACACVRTYYKARKNTDGSRFLQWMYLLILVAMLIHTSVRMYLDNYSMWIWPVTEYILPLTIIGIIEIICDIHGASSVWHNIRLHANLMILLCLLIHMIFTGVSNSIELNKLGVEVNMLRAILHRGRLIGYYLPIALTANGIIWFVQQVCETVNAKRKDSDSNSAHRTDT